MRLFLKIKDFHNNLIVRNWALISMVLIAISLFVSFKHIFVGLGHGIALELVIAALAAAFVIMPTAFLVFLHVLETRFKGRLRHQDSGLWIRLSGLVRKLRFHASFGASS